MSWAGAGRPGWGPPGLAQPINFSYDGPRPGHQLFNYWAAVRSGPSICHLMGRGPAQPSPSHFQQFAARLGPAHDIGGEGHEIWAIHGPARHSAARPVDLTRRATGRPMCSPVSKGESICASVFFCCQIVFRFFALLDPVGQPMSHRYTPTTHKICHTNGALRWPPFRLVDGHLLLLLQCPQQQQLLQHVQPAAAIRSGCCNTSCYRSVFRKEQI